MNDKSFLKASIANLGGTLFSQGVFFVASVVFIRTFTIRDLGVYSLLFQLQSLLLLIIPFGINILINRDISRNNLDNYPIIRQYITLFIGSFTLIALVFFVFSHQIENTIFPNDFDRRNEALLILITSFLSSISLIFKSILIAKSYFKIAQIPQIAGGIVALLLLFISLQTSNVTINSALLIYTAFYLVTFILSYIFGVMTHSMPLLLFTLNLDNRKCLNILTQGLTLTLSSFVYYAAFLISRIILKENTDYQIVGQFHSTQIFIQFYGYLPVALSPIALTYISKASLSKKKTELTTFINKSSIILFSTLFILYVILSIFSKLIITIVLGQNYLIINTYLWWIILGFTIITPISIILNQMLIVEQRLLLRLLIDLFWGIMFLGFTYVLTHSYAASGLAVSYMLSFSVATILLTIIYKKLIYKRHIIIVITTTITIIFTELFSQDNYMLKLPIYLFIIIIMGKFLINEFRILERNYKLTFK